MWYLFNHFSIQKQNMIETYHVWTTRTRMNIQITITTRFRNKVQHNVCVDMVRESLYLVVVSRAPICSRCHFSSWFCNWHGSRKIMLRLALWGPICIFHIWILLAKHIKATRKLENEDSEQIIFYALMLKSQNMEEWRRIKKIKIWWSLYSHRRKTRWRRLAWVLFLDLPGRYRYRTQHSLAVSLQPATRRLPQLLISGKTWPTLSSPPMREAASRFTWPFMYSLTCDHNTWSQVTNGMAGVDQYCPPPAWYWAYLQPYVPGTPLSRVTDVSCHNHTSLSLTNTRRHGLHTGSVLCVRISVFPI